MEIERKFLLSGFPDLPELERAEVFQGYLGISPEVRIRSKRVGEAETYRLCFKGEGSLVREEIELDLDKATFESLKKLLPKPMIRKEYRIYRLENGLRLECSRGKKGSVPRSAGADTALLPKRRNRPGRSGDAISRPR